jgi:hypothetical protein
MTTYQLHVEETSQTFPIPAEIGADDNPGQGAKLLKAVNEAGIPWQVVRTWVVDDQALERMLKNQKNSPRFCPICNPALAGKVENHYREAPVFTL